MPTVFFTCKNRADGTLHVWGNGDAAKCIVGTGGWPTADALKKHLEDFARSMSGQSLTEKVDVELYRALVVAEPGRLELTEPERAFLENSTEGFTLIPKGAVYCDGKFAMNENFAKEIEMLYAGDGKDSEDNDKDLFGPDALIMASAPNTDGFPHTCGRCKHFRSDLDNKHTGLCTICDMPMSWKEGDNDCPEFDAE